MCSFNYIVRTPKTSTTSPPPGDSAAELRVTSSDESTNKHPPSATDDVHQQMEELDSHRRAVQELTDKVLALNDKVNIAVCISLIVGL